MNFLPFAQVSLIYSRRASIEVAIVEMIIGSVIHSSPLIDDKPWLIPLIRIVHVICDGLQDTWPQEIQTFPNDLRVTLRPVVTVSAECV